MTKIQEAIKYMELNQSLSFHHVALKFNVNVTELQNAWASSRKIKL
jgi:hypothetical protein